MAALVPTFALGDEIPATAAPAPAPAATDAAAAPATTPAASTATPAASAQPAATASGALAALEEAEKKGGFALAADLDHSLGTGTFISPSMYASFGATLSVVPRYGFFVAGKSVSASLALRGAWEYTLPDSENARRFSPGDSRLGFAAPGLYKNELTGIAVSPSIGFIIPTSPESWQAGLITSISAGVGLSKNIWKLSFSVSGSGSRGFHVTGASQTAAQPSSAGARIDSFQARTGLNGVSEPYVSFAAFNTAWSANVSGSVAFQATDELSFVVQYGYGHSWKYTGEKFRADETIPSYAKVCSDASGVKAPCPGESDRTTAVIGANYQLTDHYGVSLSASTVQAPYERAGGSLRFPFWAGKNSADNATNISFTFSATY